MSDRRAEGRAAAEVAVPLRAGPLRLVFERGELRWIRLGEREVLRGIHVAVREPGWGTVRGRIENLVIEVETKSFRVRFLSRHHRGPVAFDWTGRIEGDDGGRVVFEMDGVARARFLKNRIGLCVLHPAEECADRPCVVETVDGARREHSFPRLVAPHQPFLGVRAIRHEVVDGVYAEVRLEGDTFETEDHRNWSDASFKTYSTPLARPYPVELRAGTRIRQTVALELHGHDEDPVPPSAMAVPGVFPLRRNSTEPVVVTVARERSFVRPSLGLGGATAKLGTRELEQTRGLGLDHVRADIHLESEGWETALGRAASNSRAAGAPLELALFLPPDPEAVLRALASRAATIDPRVDSWLLFRAGGATTAEGDAALARAVLGAVDPAARFGGGTDGHFAELNRGRPSVEGLDRLSFSLTPQVHAFDDATLVENLSSLGSIAETVRAFAGAVAVGVSPVTLRPRGDPRPATREPGEPPFTDDPRQSTAFAAAWTLGLLAAAAEARIASLTLFEMAGPRGVMEGERRFPVAYALAAVTEMKGAVVLAARSHRPERVQALALRAGPRTRILLANATRWRHPVVVEGLVGRLLRRALGEPGPAEKTGPEIELGPREILQIDLEGSS